jgi:hypothetical protein
MMGTSKKPGRIGVLFCATALLVACGDSAADESDGDSGSGGDSGSESGSGGGSGSASGNGGFSGSASGNGGFSGSAGGSGGTSGSGGDSGGASGTAGGGAGSGGGSAALLAVLPNRFGFGVASFGSTLQWPIDVQAATEIQFDYLYWYQNMDSSLDFLMKKIQRANDLGALPVITHYQLLDRSKAAGFTGAAQKDIVLQGVEDAGVMLGYFDNVQMVMETAATAGGPMIFQTEPDSTTWLRMFHTGDTHDATMGHVAVAESGHPDLADLPDTIAGYAQALVRLRDLYAPNVFMGLCEFDNRDGMNPEHSVTFIQSLGTEFDVLFTHHTVKYSTKDAGWWDAYDDVAQQRFLTWISTITGATGLKYIHWQTEIGASDYGIMPDYPSAERITPLIAAGSIGVLFDLYSMTGPPHHQPAHGYAVSPPTDHPAYNSLDELQERLEGYFAAPLTLH